MKNFTRFLNVDLELYSSLDLTALIEEMGDSVYTLYYEKKGNCFTTSLELEDPAEEHNAIEHKPSTVIYRFIDVITKLSLQNKKIFDACHTRKFSVGFQAESFPHEYTYQFDSECIRKMIELNIVLEITIYSPSKEGMKDEGDN